MKSSQRLIIMGLCNVTFTWTVLFVMLVESRPNLSIRKYKRAVPIVVNRPTYPLSEQYTKQWPINNEGQNWTTVQNVGQDWMRDKNIGITRSEAMKKLLDVLGLKVPENSSIFSAREKTKKPPKYMTDLYKAIADDKGITRDPGLLHADTVRSIPNKGPSRSNLCRFDVRALGDTEVILDAELHVFQSLRLGRKLLDVQSPPATSRIISFIKVYQILSSIENLGTQKRLIAARRIYMHHSGWHVFSVLSTVKEWISSESTNHGIVTEIIASDGEIIENSPERESLQPILVVFTNYAERGHNESVVGSVSRPTDEDQTDVPKSSDEENLHNSHERSKRSTNRHRNSLRQHAGRQNARERNQKGYQYFPAGQSGYERSESEIREIPGSEQNFRYGNMKRQKQSDEITYRSTEADEYVYTGTDGNFRDPNFASDSSDKRGLDGSKQSANHEYGRPMRISSFTYNSDPSRIMRNCQRYPLYVNFEDMGWSGWIIHPQGYNAYHCKGVCQFPLGQHLNPTNHATVQSIMHTMGLGDQTVDMPCCAPDKLYDINLLYFDQNDYVVLRRYKDMVATSCSCR